MKKKDIKKMMGTIIDEDWFVSAPAREEPTDLNLRGSFDSATEWP